MTEPYYQDEWVTLYNADCHEVLPDIPQAGLLLTDPPYGIAWFRSRIRATDLNISNHADRSGAGRWEKSYAPMTGDDEPFDPAHLLGTAKRHVIFGGNFFASRLPDATCWIVWDKKRGGTIAPEWKSAHAELAWTDFPCGVRVFDHMWAGYARDSEIGSHLHPTQKPLALMDWIIRTWTKSADVVLDPYAGSGATLRAAKDNGRRAIGIEIEERYCEVIAKRLAQGVLFGEAV